MKYIYVRGAREHNLKNIDVKIPRGKLVVITGLSGSGKSSLAFDTIYSEGQRRYLESLSAYVRQFIGNLNKPDVDGIEGLSPAIAIDQKTTSHNPRSTVATVTEIYDYLRLLYTHIGIPYCPNCGIHLKAQSLVGIADEVLKKLDNKRVMIIAPLVMGRKGEFVDVFRELHRKGFVRIMVDDKIYYLPEVPKLEKTKKHTIEVIIDRLVVTQEKYSRIYESIEAAVNLAENIVKISQFGGKEYIFSTKLACPKCGLSFPELSPRMFSFNSPYGACPVCEGLGVKKIVDENLVVKHPNISISTGAIPFISRTILYEVEAVARAFKFSLATPFSKLEEWQKTLILLGTNNKKIDMKLATSNFELKVRRAYEGVIPKIERLYLQTKSIGMRKYYESFMSELPCPACEGKRLKKSSLSVKINPLSIIEFTDLSIVREYEFLDKLKLTEQQEKIGGDLIKEIKKRLKFLINVGLGYLNLSRSATTLSGGENQRIRLGTQIGAALQGVIYVLDEPSIGLHPKDNEKLIKTLKDLRDIGNTVLVVEHDRDMIKNADYVIDMGPGAGLNGGRITAMGTPRQILTNPNSLTGLYLSNKRVIDTRCNRRRYKRKKKLILKGAEEHNLKKIDVEFPLETFICITGVSGSGKSTLINDTLFPALKKYLFLSHIAEGKNAGLSGIENLEDVVMISQDPIGRTPRSNPATYTGLFTRIRELFSQLPLSRMRGYTASRFSFNTTGGRCAACSGAGLIRIEMNFMPDIYVLCEECRGKRYNRETLEVKYHNKSIADILDMTVNQAYIFFESQHKIKEKLLVLSDVGLGYIKLGQSATTLSGGEAQRIKLASELSKKQRGGTIYLLDEPTTGLHIDDVKKLLNVLNRLVDNGNTVVVVEHNLDVIKNADYIIDLGPAGGNEGGYIVATGSPEEIVENKKSYTADYLKKSLEGN